MYGRREEEVSEAGKSKKWVRWQGIIRMTHERVALLMQGLEPWSHG
jgi:hypothetical protein